MCSADKSGASGLDVTDTVPAVDHPERNRKGRGLLFRDLQKDRKCEIQLPGALTGEQRE